MLVKKGEINCWCSPGWGAVAPAVCRMLDDLQIKLRDSTLGCHIKGICLNAAMYADDLILMSISVPAPAYGSLVPRRVQ